MADLYLVADEGEFPGNIISSALHLSQFFRQFIFLKCK
jgi:hypothetical protein